MTGPSLRVAVVTSDPIAPWQERCVDDLGAVPGVTIVVDRSAGATFDLVLDLTATGPSDAESRGSETWHFGFGEDLSRDLARIALEHYVLGAQTMRVALIREPGAVIIRDALLATAVWWHAERRERIMLTPAAWVADAARERLTGATPGTSTAAAQPGPDGRLPDRRRGGPTRTSVPSAVLKVAAVGRRLVGVAETLTRQDDWRIGIIDAPIGSMLAASASPPITWLPVRNGHFAADPFGIERDGILHVLYEDFDQRRGKGSIHHLVVDANGAASEPEPVLDLDVHASYPFVVEDRGTIFMLPELAASGDLVLYEATRFPSRWQPAATLLSGVPALDASVVRFEDRWWMFACRLDRGINEDLFVWHARDLLGPWTPHASHPVKTDPRSSRPGGTPFAVDGVLYRPSQDDSGAYGGRLVINAVTRLTPTAFEEHPVRVIAPQPPLPDGLHTLSAAGARTLVDGNRRRFVPDAFRREVGRYTRKACRKLESD